MPLSLDERRTELLAAAAAREAELASEMTAMLSAAAPAPSAVTQEDAITEDAWAEFLAPLRMTSANRHHVGRSRSAATPDLDYPIYAPGDIPAGISATALSAAAPVITEDAWAAFTGCLNL